MVCSSYPSVPVLDPNGISYLLSAVGQLILSLLCQLYHEQLDPTERDRALILGLVS